MGKVLRFRKSDYFRVETFLKINKLDKLVILSDNYLVGGDHIVDYIEKTLFKKRFEKKKCKNCGIDLLDGDFVEEGLCFRCKKDIIFGKTKGGK